MRWFVTVPIKWILGAIFVVLLLAYWTLGGSGSWPSPQWSASLYGLPTAVNRIEDAQ